MRKCNSKSGFWQYRGYRPRYYERQSSASNRTSFATLQTTHGFGEEDEPVPHLEVNYDFADDLNLSIPFSLPHLTDPDWLDLDWNAEFPLQVSEDSSLHNEVHSQIVRQGSGYGQSEPSYNPPAISEGNNKNFEPSFDFLLNFTHQSGLKSVFNYKRCRLPPSTTNHDFHQLSHHHGVSPEAAIAGIQESCGSLRTSDSSGMSSHRDQHKVSVVRLIESFDDPLFVQTKAIWDSFRASRIRSSKIALQSVDDTERTDERCLQFFCPENLRKFTHLFWDEWYPHYPILHKPTFNLVCAPVMLLVPMAIIRSAAASFTWSVHITKQGTPKFTTIF
jgi:hypothetical protein